MFRLMWASVGLYLIGFMVYLFCEPAIHQAMMRIHEAPSPASRATQLGMVLIKTSVFGGVLFVGSDFVRAMFRRK